MQTFLPERTFSKCASVLDNRRLNRQLIEATIILSTIREIQYGGLPAWRSHPAVKQWIGYERYLFYYIKAHANECAYRDIKFQRSFKKSIMIYDSLPFKGLQRPWWWEGDLKNRIIASHRIRLYRKDRSHYSQYKHLRGSISTYKCCPHCGYCWPTHLISRMENTYV